MTDHHNIAVIRELLLASFNAGSLRRFCENRPVFLLVLKSIPDRGSLEEVVDLVIEHCQTQHLFDELVAEVKKENPRQYARLESQLRISAEELAKIPCPYRGLEPFEAEHAKFYFGRETMIKQLVAKVKDHALVAVVGPSGCGKSSLVRAGLVMALRNGALSGSQNWVVRIFRPGADPLYALCRQLIALLEPKETPASQQLDTSRQASALRDGTLSMSHISADLCDTRPDISHLLLIADQFEELYTECQDEALRQDFTSVLLAAGEQKNMTIVLTLRADFYGYVLSSQALGKAVTAGLINILPMGEAELRSAIEQPAMKIQRTFEPRLVERILDDIVGEPGNLPLLEFALAELWDRQTAGGVLTHDGYEAIGEVEGAIARRAETVYAELDKKGQGDTVRRILLRLTHYGGGAEETRRRAKLVDLVTQLTPREEVEAVVKTLADARLIVTGQDETLEPGHKAATAEVSHEALIRGWGQLRAWLDQDRAFGLWREKLGAWLRIWQETGRDEGTLLRGAPLSEAEDWLAQRGEDLNEAERTFVLASQTLQQREEAEHAEQQLRAAQLAAERRSAGRLRRLAIGLGISVLVAFVLAGISLALFGTAARQRDRADVARMEADSLKLAFAFLNQFEHNPDLAFLLAIEAERAYPTSAARDAIVSSLSRPGRTLLLLPSPEGRVEDAAWAPDGRRIATAGTDGMVRVWDANDGAQLALLAGHEGDVWLVAWAPDGRHIATAGADSTVRIWDAESGAELAVLAGYPDGVMDVAWDPEGRRVVTAGPGDMAIVWDAESGTELVRLVGHESWVRQAVWDLEGRRILTGSWDNTARVWDAENGAELVRVVGVDEESLAEGGVLHTAWDPQGKRFLTAAGDGTARVWDAESGAQLVLLAAGEGWVNYASWDPEGRRIVTTGEDSTVLVWDTESGSRLQWLTGHTGSVHFAVWDPQGRRVVTSSDDGTARVWDVERGTELAQLAGHGHWVGRAAWDPEGRRVLTTAGNGVARVWDPDSGPEAAILVGHVGSVRRAAWYQDGQHIVTIGDDGTARVWQVSSSTENSEIWAQLACLASQEGVVRQAESNGGEQYVITASFDGIVRVWKLSSSTGYTEIVTKQFDFTGVRPALFELRWDGKTGHVVIADEDGTIQVWQFSDSPGETEKEKKPIVLHGHEDRVIHIAWDPEGRRIVTASIDSTARVWDTESGTELARFAVGHEYWVMYAAWDPQGQRIVTGSTDGMARVWDADSGHELAHMFVPNTWISWQAAWDPQGRRIVTAAGHDVARVWDAENGAQLLVLDANDHRVAHAAWDPEGRRIVSAGGDGTVRVWDAESGVQLLLLTGHDDEVVYAAWDPEGRRIVTASKDGTARIYYTYSEDLLVLACQRAVRNMSEEEWQQYMGDEPYHETCPGKPVPGRDF